MCGIIGIVNNDQAVRELYDGLLALQHRGQDAAGIATYDEKFNLKKGFGLVQDVFNEKNIARLQGPMGIGHVRYPTVGCGQGRDAQPFMTNIPYGIAMCHNGNLTNFAELREELARRDLRQINSDCDVEAILNVFADELVRARRDTDGDRPSPAEIFAAVEGVFRRCRGSFSVLALVAGHGLVVFRDPFGIRPLVMGTRRDPKGDGYAFASESVVLDLLGYGNREDLQPGEAVWVDHDRRIHRRRLAVRPHHPCIFEHIYFARPDSTIDDVSVYQTRVRLGEELAAAWKKTGKTADVIMPVPESARSAAVAMARALGVRYSEGLVKNRYIGRTFIMPGDQERQTGIRRKLNAIRAEFEGKRVLLVDDSIVRGNTSRKIVQMARDAGAAEVYFVSCSAPLLYPCIYGIDMQTRDEFIARGRDVEEVRRAIGADFLLYQDLEAMTRAARAGNPRLQHFCRACFTGEYPTGDVTAETLCSIERERLTAKTGR
jgi:amidophosphoribosyltransferase